jgi:hypothetical protein
MSNLTRAILEVVGDSGLSDVYVCKCGWSIPNLETEAKAVAFYNKHVTEIWSYLARVAIKKNKPSALTLIAQDMNAAGVDTEGEFKRLVVCLVVEDFAKVWNEI